MKFLGRKNNRIGDSRLFANVFSKIRKVLEAAADDQDDVDSNWKPIVVFRFNGSDDWQNFNRSPISPAMEILQCNPTFWTSTRRISFLVAVTWSVEMWKQIKKSLIEFNRKAFDSAFSLMAEMFVHRQQSIDLDSTMQIKTNDKTKQIGAGWTDLIYIFICHLKSNRLCRGCDIARATWSD